MANTASTWQYVVVTEPLRALRRLRDAFCHVKSALSPAMSPIYVAVTRIRNTWHYVIIRYSYGELPKFVLRCLYEAALRKGDHGITLLIRGGFTQRCDHGSMAFLFRKAASSYRFMGIDLCIVSVKRL